MKTYSVDINGKMYHIEQPSKDYNIFYVNRKQGTCCIAKDANKNWIIETQVNPERIPVEQIGRYLDSQIN